MMRILLIILTLFLSNCKLNKIVKHHGIHNLESKSKKLIINSSNINDINKILGPPSSTSYFNNDVLIYLEQKTSNSKLLKLGKRKLISNNVLLLEIDNRGMLIKKELLNKNDINKLRVSMKKTNVSSDKDSFLIKSLSNVMKKIDDPLGKKRGEVK